MMMSTPNKLLVWNFRGEANKTFYRYRKYYMDLYKPDMFVMLETRSNPMKLTNPLKRLGFDDCISMENTGFARSIYVRWKI